MLSSSSGIREEGGLSWKGFTGWCARRWAKLCAAKKGLERLENVRERCSEKRYERKHTTLPWSIWFDDCATQ
eukprot:614669-Amphidinium_carterae.1